MHRSPLVSHSAGLPPARMAEQKVNTMRYVTFAAAGLLGLAAMQALAQAPSLTSAAKARAGSDYNQRDSEPHSDRSSNIASSGTRSTIAPTLPMPAIPENATPMEYLRSARESLAGGRTGQAQQSLEMAETRVLARSVSQEKTYIPSDDKLVLRIANALRALGAGDRALAMQIIDTALTP